MKRAVALYLELLGLSQRSPGEFSRALEQISASGSGQDRLAASIFEIKRRLLNMDALGALSLAQKTYEKLRARGVDELRAQVASHLGSIYIILSNYELAETYFAEALSLYERYKGVLPRSLHAGYLYNYTITIARDGRFREASRHMERLWEEISLLDSGEDFKTMFRLRVAIFMVRTAAYRVNSEVLFHWTKIMDGVLSEAQAILPEEPFEQMVIGGAYGVKGIAARFGRGDLVGCVDHSLASMKHSLRHGLRPEFEYLRNAAECLVATGREGEASEIFRRAREFQGDGEDINSLYAKEITALEERVNARPEMARQLLKEIGDWYEEKGLPPECLYARVVGAYTDMALLGRGEPDHLDYIQRWLPVYPFIKADPIYGMFVKEALARRAPRVSAPKPEMRFWLFGDFRMEAGGILIGSARWERKKALSALKYLLLHRGRKVLVDELTFVLWPDETDEVARKRLWVSMSYIRKVLGQLSRHLVTEDGAYVLRDTPDIWVDAVQFERSVKRALALADTRPDEAISLLDEALSLYRDDLLPGDRFQRWLDEHRRYFHKLFVKAVLLAAELRGREDLQASADLLEGYIEQWPLQEEFIAALVKDLKKMGMGSRAEAVYKDFKRLLWNKHRLKPGFEP